MTGSGSNLKLTRPTFSMILIFGLIFWPALYPASALAEPAHPSISRYSQSNPENSGSEFEDPFGDPFAKPQQKIRLSDPFEYWNREMFQFNDSMYRHFIRPSSNAWQTISTPGMRAGVDNFFFNLKEPRNFVNALLQAEFHHAEQSFGRFLINTIFGLGGIYDVTADEMPPRTHTFDETLSQWGVGPGPYLVLPGIGPTSVRGAAGWTADGGINPSAQIDLKQAAVLQGFRVTNEFVTLGPNYEEMKNITLDPYLGMKSYYESYLQNRGKASEPAW